jgi:hypothetical protein
MDSVVKEAVLKKEEKAEPEDGAIQPAVPTPAQTQVANVPVPAKAQAVHASPQVMPSAAAQAAPAVVFSAGLEPSQSWLARNKYVLAALLVIAGAAAVILLLR